MVTNELKKGEMKNLFNTNNIIGGKEPANTFARGHYGLVKYEVDEWLDRIRKVVETCNSFDGFIMTHAISGGTGSGALSLLSERLSVEYGKKPKINFTIYPSRKAGTSVLDSYHSVLSTHSLL